MNNLAPLLSPLEKTPTENTSRWYDICAEVELTEGIGVAARLRDIQIALFRLGERVFATGNFDPFSEANVISRGIVGDLGGAPVVASPVYKQHFRLEDGFCIEDPSVQIPVWSARCRSGRVEVNIPADLGCV